MGLHVREDFVELGAASAMSAVVLCLLFAVVCCVCVEWENECDACV